MYDNKNIFFISLDQQEKNQTYLFIISGLFVTYAAIKYCRKQLKQPKYKVMEVYNPDDVNYKVMKRHFIFYFKYDEYYFKATAEKACEIFNNPTFKKDGKTI